MDASEAKSFNGKNDQNFGAVARVDLVFPFDGPKRAVSAVFPGLEGPKLKTHF